MKFGLLTSALVGTSLVGRSLAVQMEVTSRAAERAQALLNQASMQSSGIGRAEVALETVQMLAQTVSVQETTPGAFTASSNITGVFESLNELLSQIVEDMVEAKRHNQVLLRTKYAEILVARANLTDHDAHLDDLTDASKAALDAMENDCGKSTETPDSWTNQPTSWAGLDAATSKVEDDCAHTNTDFTDFPLRTGRCHAEKGVNVGGDDDIWEEGQCILPTGVTTLGKLKTYLANNSWQKVNILEDTSSYKRSALHYFFMKEMQHFVSSSITHSQQCLEGQFNLFTKTNKCNEKTNTYVSRRCAQDMWQVMHCQRYAAEVYAKSEEYKNYVLESVTASNERGDEALIVNRVHCFLNVLNKYIEDKNRVVSGQTADEVEAKAKDDMLMELPKCSSQNLIPRPLFGEGATWTADGTMSGGVEAVTNDVTKLEVYELPSITACSCSPIPLCEATVGTNGADHCDTNLAGVELAAELNPVLKTEPFTIKQWREAGRSAGQEELLNDVTF